MNAFAHHDFAAALLDPQRPLPAGLAAWNGSDPARRFAVYRNNVIVSLVAALAETFPVLRRLVGDEFFDAMAALHVREHPPTSPVLADYGAGFAGWLEGFAPAQALPYLPDMARLEHARVMAFHAADAAPLAAEAIAARCADASHLPGSWPILHPSCRVLRSPFAVEALWAAHQHDGEMPAVDIDRPGAALVLRDPGDEVLVVPLPPAAAAFCAALRCGTTLAQALAETEGEAGAAGFDLAGTLALLIRHGALVAWHTPTDTPAP